MRKPVCFGFAVLVGACSAPDNPQGRQSGTEDDSTVCYIEDTSVSLDASWNGVPVEQLTTAEGMWWTSIPNTVGYADYLLNVRIDNARQVVNRHFNSPADCGSDQLVFTADFTFSLDGTVEPVQATQVKGVVKADEFGLLEQGEPHLYLELSLASDLDPELGLRMEWTQDHYEVNRLQVPNEPPLIAGYDTFRPYTPFGNTPMLEELCAVAEATPIRNFESPQAVLEALLGDWAVCDSATRPPSTGVRFADDYTWQLIGGEELTLQSGFVKAGAFQVMDISEQNDTNGLFQFWGDWGIPAAGVLQASETGETLTGDRTLVRLDAPVAAPANIPFALGERAGRAGCESTEAATTVFGDDGRSAIALMSGRWAICDSSRDLHFESLERATLLDASGDIVSVLDLQYENAISGAQTVLMVGSETWYVTISDQPLKAYIERRENTGEGSRKITILSALPE